MDFLRSKYAEYPEYHTSADDFNVVTAGGLEGAFDTLKAVIDGFECGGRPKVTVMCEPQLSKRGTLSNRFPKLGIIVVFVNE